MRLVLLVCELLSALCSAAGKYLASVGGCHSLHKAVFLLAMELLRLVSSFHLEPSLILVLADKRIVPLIHSLSV